jgi:hypothetical protein
VHIIQVPLFFLVVERLTDYPSAHFLPSLEQSQQITRNEITLVHFACAPGVSGTLAESRNVTVAGSE